MSATTDDWPRTREIDTQKGELKIALTEHPLLNSPEIHFVSDDAEISCAEVLELLPEEARADIAWSFRGGKDTGVLFEKFELSDESSYSHARSERLAEAVFEAYVTEYS